MAPVSVIVPVNRAAAQVAVCHAFLPVTLRRITLLLFFSMLLRADDRWLEMKAGPFEVLTTDEKKGRLALNELEQIRFVVGNLIGKPEPKLLWPVRVLVVKPGKLAIYPELKLARDAWVASIDSVTPETRRSLVQALLDSNAGRMPSDLERGLVDLFSTFTADGPRVTLGAPVDRPTRDWSRMHMLVLDPRFSGKLRVLLYNLQQGVEDEPAYRNAFATTKEQVEIDLNHYIEANRFTASPVSGKPLDPRRQLVARDADPKRAELVLLDLKVANGEKALAADYSRFPGALDAPVPVLQRAIAEKDSTKARALFEQAAKGNPLWAEPFREQAKIEDNPLRRVQLLKKASELSPRNTEYHVALAKAQEAAGQYNDAIKTWGVAERSTRNNDERERLRQARLAGEEQRREQARAEKEAERRKAQEEIEALRQKAIANIRAAEARANAGHPARDPEEKLETWRENMGYGKVSGRLSRVDCIGSQAVLHISSAAGGVTRLFVPNASKVVITGGGEHALTCGLQKPAREVTAEYIEKTSGKLKTAGEVSTLEFR